MHALHPMNIDTSDATSGDTTPVRAVTLLLCDNRQPLSSDESLSADSLPALALKRHRVRKYASAEDIKIEAEVLIELEKGIDFEFLVDKAIHEITAKAPDAIICPDVRSLHEAGLLQALESRLPASVSLLIPI